MEWIKCSDKLPDKDDRVDILCDGWNRRTDYKYEGNGVFYNNEWDRTYEVEAVTHWMPVPPLPPKE